MIASNIVTALDGPDERVGRILDPCAGTGEPLALLGNHLGLRTYGVELHPDRYAQAKPRLDVCLNGAREFLETDGLFNLVFSNPPYDQDAGGQRMEVAHIRADLELLLAGGLGIWVIPETILDNGLCLLLATHLRQITIRRFPQPEYDRFKQVVIFGLKRDQPASTVYSPTKMLEEVLRAGPPILQVSELAYRYPDTELPLTTFRLSLPDTSQVLTELETVGVHTLDAWQTLLGSTGMGFDQFQPVLPLTAGHTAMAIAAGIVNGTAVEIDGQPHLIKGSTGKRLTVITETEATEDGTERTIREREQLVQTITALNLIDGRLTSPNSLDDKQGFADFLLHHQASLVASIEQNFPPLFEPERDLPIWLPALNRVRAPGKLTGRLVAAGLLPAQQVRAAALAARLQTDKAVLLVGEMGSGKSATSLALAALIGQGNWKLVIVCPAQITAKWKRETETVLADFGVKVHLIGHKHKQADGQGQWRKVGRPVLDTLKAMAEPNPAVLVMSYETAKMGARWTHAPASQRKPVTYTVEIEEPLASYPYVQIVEKPVTKMLEVLCCPDCGKILRNEYGHWVR